MTTFKNWEKCFKSDPILECFDWAQVCKNIELRAATIEQ